MYVRPAEFNYRLLVTTVLLKQPGLAAAFILWQFLKIILCNGFCFA
jgi:hypothetical protein